MCNRLPEINKNGDAGIFPVYYSLKLTIVTHLSFSERIAIANLSLLIITVGIYYSVDSLSAICDDHTYYIHAPTTITVVTDYIFFFSVQLSITIIAGLATLPG